MTLGEPNRNKERPDDAPWIKAVQLGASLPEEDRVGDRRSRAAESNDFPAGRYEKRSQNKRVKQAYGCVSPPTPPERQRAATEHAEAGVMRERFIKVFMTHGAVAWTPTMQSCAVET